MNAPWPKQSPFLQLSSSNTEMQVLFPYNTPGMVARDEPQPCTCVPPSLGNNREALLILMSGLVCIHFDIKFEKHLSIFFCF